MPARFTTALRAIRDAEHFSGPELLGWPSIFLPFFYYSREIQTAREESLDAVVEGNMNSSIA